MPLVRLYDRLLKHRYGFESRADEVHRHQTHDGETLFIKRFRPTKGSPRRQRAVLCVPGLGADSHNFDCPAPYGLAPYFAEAGFDVFVVDLRGTGLSHVPRHRWSAISFDQMLTDVPGLVEHVRERSGLSELLYVGHSMGGMLLYAALGTGRAAHIRAGVTLAAPLGFPQGWAASPALGRVKGLVGALPGLYFKPFIMRLMPVAFGPRDATSRRYAVLDNLDVNFAKQLVYNSVQDVPRDLARQFRDWIDNDAFRSLDQRIDYRARLAGSTLPILLCCAPHDQLGKPESVRRGLDLLENPTYLECGTAAGMSTDYGHCDLVFGTRAPQEVFPRLLEFLVQHDHDARPRVPLQDAATVH